MLKGRSPLCIALQRQKRFFRFRPRMFQKLAAINPELYQPLYGSRHYGGNFFAFAIAGGFVLSIRQKLL